jgi:hypothetical protein
LATRNAGGSAKGTQRNSPQADIKKLQGVEFSQQKGLEDFLAGFTAE